MFYANKMKLLSTRNPHVCVCVSVFSPFYIYLTGTNIQQSGRLMLYRQKVQTKPARLCTPYVHTQTNPAPEVEKQIFSNRHNTNQYRIYTSIRVCCYICISIYRISFNKHLLYYIKYKVPYHPFTGKFV